VGADVAALLAWLLGSRAGTMGYHMRDAAMEELNKMGRLGLFLKESLKSTFTSPKHCSPQMIICFEQT
jgi:hypothetical protein